MAGHLADSRKLPAVKKHMMNRQLRFCKKRTGQVCPQGGRHQRKLRDPLLDQISLQLPQLVRLADIVLSRTVDGRGWHYAVISVFQMLRHRTAALAGHTHGVKEQNGRVLYISDCLKNHKAPSFLNLRFHLMFRKLELNYFTP